MNSLLMQSTTPAVPVRHFPSRSESLVDAISTAMELAQRQGDWLTHYEEIHSSRVDSVMRTHKRPRTDVAEVEHAYTTIQYEYGYRRAMPPKEVLSHMAEVGAKIPAPPKHADTTAVEINIGSCHDDSFWYEGRRRYRLGKYYFGVQAVAWVDTPQGTFKEYLRRGSGYGVQAAAKTHVTSACWSAESVVVECHLRDRAIRARAGSDTARVEFLRARVGTLSDGREINVVYRARIECGRLVAYIDDRRELSAAMRAYHDVEKEGTTTLSVHAYHNELDRGRCTKTAARYIAEAALCAHIAQLDQRRAMAEVMSAEVSNIRDGFISKLSMRVGMRWCAAGVDDAFAALGMADLPPNKLVKISSLVDAYQQLPADGRANIVLRFGSYVSQVLQRYGYSRSDVRALLDDTQ